MGSRKMANCKEAENHEVHAPLGHRIKVGVDRSIDRQTDR